MQPTSPSTNSRDQAIFSRVPQALSVTDPEVYSCLGSADGPEGQ